MEIIMAAASVMFFILLSFIAFVFTVYIASLFVKKDFPEFEPLVSIIIPAYNEAGNISACIDALLASNYPKEKLEIMLVDDGSTDNTREIAESYKQVKILLQNHKGKSDALTLGAKSAKNGFIVCLDADTVIEPDCIRELVKPFSEKDIGATTALIKVRNTNSLLGMFQRIEYHYNNLIRSSFSKVFGNGVWFFGAMSCYRKAVLEKVNYFKKDTMTEDMDISLEIKRAGYRTYSARNAMVSTIVPDTLSGFYRQRSRWWLGGLQSMRKNRELFSTKSSPSILFVFVNQMWWSFYAFLSLPIIIYQVHYWFPAGAGLAEAGSYLFRWFTLSGPFYVIYKIPEWGVSAYSLFGVLSGLMSAFLIASSILMFKDKLHPKNAIALFLYFPYTILLNMVIFISLLRFRTIKTTFFLKG